MHIMRAYSPGLGRKMRPIRYVVGKVEEPLNLAEDERVVFAGACTEWQGTIDGKQVTIASCYRHPHEVDERKTKSNDMLLRTLKSLWKCFWITNGYMVIMALFNLLVGGNYLFICHKPPTPSLIDALGPWPWYVLSLEGVGLAFFFIYYLPFGIRDLIAAQKRATA